MRTQEDKERYIRSTDPITRRKILIPYRGMWFKCSLRTKIGEDGSKTHAIYFSKRKSSAYYFSGEKVGGKTTHAYHTAYGNDFDAMVKQFQNHLDEYLEVKKNE